MSNKNRKIIDNFLSRTKIYIIIIAILLILICVIKPEFIVLAIIMFLLILLYSYQVNKKRKAEISDHIHELIGDVDSAAKNTLINSPFPLVILETDGNIIWKSAKFVDEFASTDINAYLDEIIREVKQEINNFNGKRQSIMKQIKIVNKTYKVLGEYVKSKKGKKDEYMMTLYFIDNTENVELYSKYINCQTCIGIIMIDNYEEIMQRLEAEEKPQVIASLEKTIYDWASLTSGLVIKTERDTFIYVFEKKYLEQIESSKFSILDTIKEILADGKQQLTVSIAISDEGDSNYEKYKSATAALDIALGRGGDQAVIRENGKYTFFGGRTQEVEKRTKVKARTFAGALEELILASSNVMIMGHTNGDIDSMGSSLGIYRLAKTLGKEANIVNNSSGDALENFLTALLEQEEYQEALISKQDAIQKTGKETVLVVCDTHKKTYVEAPELLEQTSKIVVIDHHRKSTEFIENPTLAFHEVYASSAAELVIEILQYASKEIKLEPMEIEALYGGIMVDTKNFTFKTGVRTFEAAAYLRKCGVDIIRVKKWFQSDLESYGIISEIVRNAEIVNESIGISIYDKEDKSANLICAKAADELLTISDITASFVLGHQGDKVCISGRSIGDINVQIILEKLGGGGHITLAGAQVEGMTIEEAKQELIIRINEYFSEIG
ncbi:MAG: DHH family phosphoesterase [Clostridia bacterium]|nr:DHH family phosphoesterase [Clostridia bacterium]